MAMFILTWGGTQMITEKLCRACLHETCDKIKNQVLLGIMWYTIRKLENQN